MKSQVLNPHCPGVEIKEYPKKRGLKKKVMQVHWPNRSPCRESVLARPRVLRGGWAKGNTREGRIIQKSPRAFDRLSGVWLVLHTKELKGVYSIKLSNIDEVN